MPKTDRVLFPPPETVSSTCKSAQRDAFQDRSRFFGVRPGDLAHTGQDDRRVHVVRADTVFSQLDSHGPGDLIHGTFGRAVRRMVRDGSLQKTTNSSESVSKKKNTNNVKRRGSTTKRKVL